MALISYFRNCTRGLRRGGGKFTLFCWSNNSAGNYLLISPVLLIYRRSLKIIDSHNALCALNGHLIKFSPVSYTNAPHFTLKCFDSITQCTSLGISQENGSDSVRAVIQDGVYPHQIIMRLSFQMCKTKMTKKTQTSFLRLDICISCVKMKLSSFITSV